MLEEAVQVHCFIASDNMCATIVPNRHRYHVVSSGEPKHISDEYQADFSAIKHGAFLINTACGVIVDEHSLMEALG